MFRKLLYFVFVMSMLFVLTGCWENSLLDRSLIFSTHTTLGLEIAVSPAETSAPAKIIIGYKRSEGVLNPVYHSEGIHPGNAGGTPKYRPEAYSVIAKIHGEVGAKAADTAEGTMSVAQWFATGEAAKILARQPGITAAVSGSSKIAEAEAQLAAIASTSVVSTSLRNQLDKLMDEKQLKENFTEDDKSFADTKEYVEYAAKKINPEKSWIRIRAEAGSELKQLIERVENAVNVKK